MHRSIVHRLLDGELLCYSLPTRTDHRVQREGGRILGGAKHRGLKPSELRQTFTLTLKPRIVLLSREQDSKYEIMALKELVGRKEDASFVMSKRQRGC
jgi:hypothetical protein